MNKIVANTFSIILSFMHVAVIVGLSVFVYQVYHNPYQLAVYGIDPSLYGNDPSASIWIAIGLFVAYVVLAGILSTFVAIYERLGEISRKLDNN